ncbi:MAG: dienelactone hydrolase [Burkholderiales bacterium]|nr:MAG: dienelactone hydrolase [Burkholderiales bacterium]TAG80502.1 MAG: dienelactone hydrolase [Betaproteobacteria bacterium]
MKKFAASTLVSVTMFFAGASAAAPQIIDTELKDSSRDRVIPIKVRVPEGTAKAPLVIFSHGLGGSVEGGKTWGEVWSASGYLVVHVQHPGSDTPALRESFASGDGEPKQRMRNIATPENLIGRVDDVRFLISEIERKQRSNATSWMSRVDLSRIAMTGHSFGAHTTMALAGQRYPGPVKTLSDPRIKAFIALSPNATGLPRTFPDRFGSMNAPFLSITGTQDAEPFAAERNMKKMVEKRTAVFEHQPAGDKYLLVLEGADHMVFNGNEQQSMRSIRQAAPLSAAHRKRIEDAVGQSSRKFLDAYLRDDSAAKAWLQIDATKAFTGVGVWSSK